MKNQIEMFIYKKKRRNECVGISTYIHEHALNVQIIKLSVIITVIIVTSLRQANEINLKAE